MTITAKSGIGINLLMSDAVVLLQTIKARIAAMDAVVPDSIDEDALADLYEDRDGLARLQGYIQHEFNAAYGALPPDEAASYEDALK